MKLERSKEISASEDKFILCMYVCVCVLEFAKIESEFAVSFNFRTKNYYKTNSSSSL